MKDIENLRKAFREQADYLPENQSEFDLWDFSQMSLELTRPFRGLGIWLPFKVLGASVFRRALEEKLDLAHYFHNEIQKNQIWEIIAPPELSLTVFRYYNPQKTVEELNSINRKILDTVNKKFRTNISATVVNGNFVIRNCILSFRTHKEHVDWLIEDLNMAVNRVIQ